MIIKITKTLKIMKKINVDSGLSNFLLDNYTWEYQSSQIKSLIYAIFVMPVIVLMGMLLSHASFVEVMVNKYFNRPFIVFIIFLVGYSVYVLRKYTVQAMAGKCIQWKYAISSEKNKKKELMTRIDIVNTLLGHLLQMAKTTEFYETITSEYIDSLTKQIVEIRQLIDEKEILIKQHESRCELFQKVKNTSYWKRILSVLLGYDYYAKKNIYAL
jgi:hypothetical protein